jgi:hypothetical protein
VPGYVDLQDMNNAIPETSFYTDQDVDKIKTVYNLDAEANWDPNKGSTAISYTNTYYTGEEAITPIGPHQINYRIRAFTKDELEKQDEKFMEEMNKSYEELMKAKADSSFVYLIVVVQT